MSTHGPFGNRLVIAALMVPGTRFEWGFGSTKRFGIVHVDHDTQHRTVKDSGRWYAALAARNA